MANFWPSENIGFIVNTFFDLHVTTQSSRKSDKVVKFFFKEGSWTRRLYSKRVLGPAGFTSLMPLLDPLFCLYMHSGL